jgi:biopolymer transport protein ExbD
MKVKPPKQAHYESGPNMTPLVDVVMVILIFLMLAGSFGTAERYMVTTLPFMEGGRGGGPRDPNEEANPAKVEITVQDTGDVKFPDNSPPITDVKEALPKELAARLKVHTDNGREVKAVQLIIKPGPNTEWDKIAPVYGAAMHAKFTNIGFKVAQ